MSEKYKYAVPADEEAAEILKARQEIAESLKIKDSVIVKTFYSESDDLYGISMEFTRTALKGGSLQRKFTEEFSESGIDKASQDHHFKINGIGESYMAAVQDIKNILDGFKEQAKAEILDKFNPFSQKPN